MMVLWALAEISVYPDNFPAMSFHFEVWVLEKMGENKFRMSAGSPGLFLHLRH